MEKRTCWQILSASVTGASHLHSQRPCQDVSRVVVTTNNQVIAAVADGLGSAELAERGAQCAVQAAVDSLQAALAQSDPADEAGWQALLQQAFAQARLAVEAQAAAEAGTLGDYASTLIVAVLSEAWSAIGHLGDGAVVARLAGEEIVTLSAPQRGEYANETAPLTSVDALTQVRYVCHSGPAEAVALFSDGLQNLCLSTADATPYVPFFDPLFAQLQQSLNLADGEAALASFLQSERISKRSDDDKTLVLIGQVAE